MQPWLQGTGRVFQGKRRVALVRYTLNRQEYPGEPEMAGTLELMDGALGLDVVFDRLTLHLEEPRDVFDFYITSLGATVEIRGADGAH